MKRWLTTLCLSLAAAVVLYAQAVPGTLIQYSPTRLDATTNFATNAASNTTLTITPPGGQYVYITDIEINNCQGTQTTGVAPTSVTTTGFGGGTTPVWLIGSTGTAGQCNPAVSIGMFTPIKSNSAGTAITFVLPTFATQQTIRVNVTYYFGA